MSDGTPECAKGATEIGFGLGRVTRFYVPLLLQAFSQSLSYPLVAGIVTHGESGVRALTAFSQGLMIMFMIGSIGAGLVTTGLVFARTWYGYVSFQRLNRIMMGALLVLQCLPALPPFGEWIFEGFFALPADLAMLARGTLAMGSVMNAGFFLRNEPMVVLFNRLQSAKANNATLARIAVTVVCSFAFPKAGWTGPWWGLAALTIGVWVEYAVTWLYARPYVAELPNRPTDKEREAADAMFRPKLTAMTWEQFRFTLPLALGGFLLATAPLVIAAFVGRTANAGEMLTVHYVTIGVANPIAYAALRMQAVSVKFPPAYPGDRRLLLYAIAAGAVLGAVPFAFSTAAVGEWYFGTFQNVPSHLVMTARRAIAIYSSIGIIQAVRARIEGIAAVQKRPSAIMVGQIVYTMSLFFACLLLLPTGCPGWLMALIAIFVAPIGTTLAIYGVLWLAPNEPRRSDLDGCDSR